MTMPAGRDKAISGEVLFISSLTADSGSGVRFWNMARAVADAGHPVTFLERRPEGIPGRAHPGITYRSCPELRPLPLAIAASLWAGMRLALGRRWRAVYALKPMPNAVLPALLARLRGSRAVLDVDDLDFEYYPPGWQRRIVRFCFRLFPRHFAAVSVHVPALRDYLESACGVPAARIRLIPQGVDLDLFPAPGAEISRPGPAEGEPAAEGTDAAIDAFASRWKTIVYMASLGITSDFEDVLPLFRRLLEGHPDWGVLVLGHGVRREAFRERVGELGLAGRFLFAGYLPHEAVPAVLARCRAGFHYLRPGGANRYRAIMKIREYLAAGLAVAANPSGDAEDFRDFVFLARTDDEYDQALALIMAGEGAGRASRGRRFLEQELAWPRLAPKILEILGLLSATERSAPSANSAPSA